MLEMKKVFISGPMTGLPNYNREAFEEAEELLNRAGFTVVNPAKFGIDGLTDADIARIDLSALLSCNYIYQLEGWSYSKGASAEWSVALWAGIKTVNKEWLEWYVEKEGTRTIVMKELAEEKKKSWVHPIAKAIENGVLPGPDEEYPEFLTKCMNKPLEEVCENA